MQDPIDRTLRGAHRTVLAMIASCAVLSAIQPGAEEEPAPDPTVSTVAVALGLATIFARRSATSPVISPRTRVVLTLCAYACGFALALLGSGIAMTADQKKTGLVFALAAALFCLRPPSRATAR